MLKSCRHLFAHHEFWLAVLIVLLSVFLSITNEDFMTLGNVFDMTTSTAILAIMACGLFVVLVSGGIDISFPGHGGHRTVCDGDVCAVTGRQFLYRLCYRGDCWFTAGADQCPADLPPESTVYYYHHFHPERLFRPADLFHQRRMAVRFPEWFMDGVEVMSFTGSDGYDYGLSLPILTLIAVIIFTGFLMSKTRIGRQIYAVGGNADAAKRVGISILGVMLFVYGYMGALAGIASVVQTQITQSVAPNALMGFELTVLAAVVLGGVSMTGGKGSLTGVILGVALLAIVKNGLTLAGVPSYWHTVLTGLIIVISISFTAYNEKRRAAAGGHLS